MKTAVLLFAVAASVAWYRRIREHRRLARAVGAYYAAAILA